MIDLKKTKLTVTLLILIILLSSLAPVFAAPSRKIEKKVFIHYKKGYGKPEGTPGVGPDKDKPGEEDGSYVLLSKGLKWKDPEPIVISTTVPNTVTASQVETAFKTSAETWQLSAGSTLYTSISSGYCDGVDQDSPDDRNEIMFGDYPQSGVIAVTIVWGVFNGPPGNREIVEFDMLFDTDFTWGNADIDGYVMDLENIATHEFGHAFGLGDLYSTADNLETMYGYASEGETIKRDLYLGDIAGIQSLYG